MQSVESAASSTATTSTPTPHTLCPVTWAGTVCPVQGGDSPLPVGLPLYGQTYPILSVLHREQSLEETLRLRKHRRSHKSVRQQRRLVQPDSTPILSFIILHCFGDSMIPSSRLARGDSIIRHLWIKNAQQNYGNSLNLTM